MPESPVNPTASVLAVGIAERRHPALESESWTVEYVRGAADAREALGRGGVDCVVSGAGFDDGDALTLLGWLRDRDVSTPFVLAPDAGDGSDRLASDALGAGATDYVHPDADLAARIERAISERPARDGDSAEETLGDDPYRTLAENLPNGAVALYDTEMRYRLVAGMALVELGIDPSSFEGERLEDVHSASFVENELPHYRAALDGERTEFEFTYDGRVFRGFTVPMYEDGAVVGGLSLTQDVTADRRRRQRLEKFAGIVSHDLRTPLSVAVGSQELIASILDEALEENLVEEHLQRLERSLQRMGDIIDDLLELARLGQDAVETGPVSLTTCVTAAWGVVADASASLDVDPAADVVVRADESALQRLLENLFANATEHGASDDGSVSVRVVGRESDGAFDGFAVVDDGPGFAADDPETLFESGVTTGGNGLGLGLSIVRDIATLHGWRVVARDDGDGGATVEIRGVELATE